MSNLPTISPPQTITLPLEPLTPTSFSPFGTAILSPLSPNLTSIPSSPPPPLHPSHQPAPIYANAKTALKTSPISPLINNYPSAVDGKGRRREGEGQVSVFSCFPRRNLYRNRNRDEDGNEEREGEGGKGGLRLRVDVLERHPFTTQTFCPFGFSVSSSSTSSTSTCTPTSSGSGSGSGSSFGSGPGSNSSNGLWHNPTTIKAASPTYFLIIVAPTINNESATPSNPPDLTKIRAFVAPVTADLVGSGDGGAGGMAVTYNAGTWHAPMVVVGSRRVDFLVTQFANGVPEDDCQEVKIGDDEDGRRIVQVDLGSLELGDGGAGVKKRKRDGNSNVKARL